ncbi:MAG TPA: YoaK family protein [Pinirhizobacter sp.]|uniref:YoaK family protein n=1 Tax=Pinirhizobacter sp. TaxID=2950432 RepID=UPI002BC3D152|nr:YoaK family protein [Pinirhizobacter sp.]HMH67256.1 YoaK family protein [Pinirhizobacter sp.]
MVTETPKPLPFLVPAVLGLTAGYVDTASFMALHGLFTAHVTGNFVTIGAAIVFGTAGVVTKLLALPTFCVALLVFRLLHYRLVERGWQVLKAFLGLQVVLLGMAGAVAIYHGSFSREDDWATMTTGLLLVVGMAVQNGVQRVHMGSAPPTTIMTGTTTQIMLDLADLVHGTRGEQRAVITGRLARMGQAVLVFAVGCALGALLYATTGVWCFALPPLLVLLAYLQCGKGT